MRIAAVLAVASLCCSCEERNKLASEIAATKREIAEMQPKYSEALQELTRTNKAYQGLLNTPSVRKGAVDRLEQEISDLTRKKEIIDSEIAAMREDFEAYRKANP